MPLWPTSFLYTLSSAEVVPVEWSVVNWGLATSSGDSHTWRKNAKLSRQDAKSGHQNETQERGGIPRFSNNSTTEQYFKMLLSHEGVYSLLQWQIVLISFLRAWGGLRLLIQDVYSKEKPLISNVHINI